MNNENSQGYSRRDFLQLSAGLGAAALMSTAGCSSSMATSATDTDFWLAVRQNDFTLPADSIYLNNSTLGATLKSVRDKMTQVNGIFAEGCDLDRWFTDVIRPLPAVLASFVKLVNAPTDSASAGRYCGIVTSVTEGMSLVANGLTFARGDTIVATDFEHPGGLVPWKLQEQRYGARVIQVPLLASSDTEATWAANLVQRFRDACTAAGNVRVISFPAITTSTGHILPARELCALARSVGAVSVVDAAQAFAILPLDMQALDCDALVVNGHKYLCGPIGSGFVAVNPRRVSTISSFWSTVVDDNYFHPEDPQRNLPQRKGGVQAYTNILPLAEALAQIDKLGMQNVHDRLAAIGQRLRDDLSLYPDRFELVTPRNSALSCVMTCFRIKGRSSEEVYQLLRDQYRIHVKHATEGFASAGGTVNGTVRLSPHYYVTEDEMSRILTALHAIAGV